MEFWLTGTCPHLQRSPPTMPNCEVCSRRFGACQYLAIYQVCAQTYPEHQTVPRFSLATLIPPTTISSRQWLWAFQKNMWQSVSMRPAMPAPDMTSSLHMQSLQFCLLCRYSIHVWTYGMWQASPHVRFWACRKFRVVPAALYLEYFASDRTHMLEEGSPEGQLTYSKPPPQYECIVSQSESPLMHLCLSMPALLGSQQLRAPRQGTGSQKVLRLQKEHIRIRLAPGSPIFCTAKGFQATSLTGRLGMQAVS